jgi:hypothetical protein
VLPVDAHPPELQRSSERSHDRDTARRRWAVSVEPTGVECDFGTLAGAAAPPRLELAIGFFPVASQVHVDALTG